MTMKNKPIDVECVACEVCLKEVPKSTAIASETTDYVAYFCGLNCYEKWKNQSVKTSDQSKKSSL
ncbi:hypothetical protein GALL_193260 [mine drainage metagenome]|uniref:DUF3330 domain-containing protein n=1 Tax=mine drainage metagenome TaxID=410659 RepID=A0A1J5S348_9ZZZZ